MTNQPDLKMKLLSALRGKDVELSEDLYRRMPACYEVSQLNNFFHSLLAQYPTDTMDIRLQLPTTDNFDDWYPAFVAKIFPFLAKKRLPSCTDSHLAPMYGASAK